MERVDVLSGIQPTGAAHIGNYLGAFKKWLEMQEELRCFYCIVDLHALTVQPKAKVLREASLEMARVFLAIGLNPEKSALFIQSHVPGHAELAWIFQCLTPMGDLARMTQFKDKSQHQPGNINCGLYSYPVLQAADILIYRASGVPVGEDQVQHLELSREIARRFNKTYRKVFPEPKAVLSKVPRILGLDGESKMSKSKGNHIPLLASEQEITKKVRSAVTDPQRQRRDDPGRPEVCNVFTLHQQFSTPDEVRLTETECREALRGCVDCKMILAKNMADSLAPIRQRYAELESEPERVTDALADGARRASAVAGETMRTVRAAVGIGD